MHSLMSSKKMSSHSWKGHLASGTDFLSVSCDPFVGSYWFYNSAASVKQMLQRTVSDFQLILDAVEFEYRKVIMLLITGFPVYQFTCVAITLY